MADLTGAERAVVDDWVEETIASVANALNAIDVGLSSRVYADMAPDDAPYPFIVYQCQDDPTDVRGVGTTTVMAQTLYLVKVVAPVGYTTLAPIVAVLNAALTTSTGSAPSVGGRVLSSVKERGFHLNETVDGKQLRNLGALYAIQVQGNA